MESEKFVKASDVKEYFKRAILGADQKVDKWVDAIPAADVRPVVRGEWVPSSPCKHKPYRVRNTDRWTIYKCSLCGQSNGRRFNTKFCPNCGAVMKGAER